jgi:hypothetical protein
VRRNQADLVTTVALAVLAGAAAWAGASTAVMVVLGIGLLAAPGYVWGEVILGPAVTGLERVAVAAGLSLAGPILGGLLLQLGGFSLRRATWVSLLVILTLVGDAVLLLLRRRADPPDCADQHDREGRPHRTGWTGAAMAIWRAARTRGAVAAGRAVWTSGSAAARGRRLLTWPVAAFGAAVLIAAGGVGLARYGAAVQHDPGFTQLWLTPPSRHAPAAELGVSNHQGTVMRYWLVLDRNGHTTATRDLTLADGQTWQWRVPFTGHSAISASLYRLPDLAHPYRHVFAAVRTGPRP